MDRLRQIVDLVLQLLHVSVRLVIFARLLLEAELQLVLVVLVGILDLCVDLLDDVIHILSLAHLAENVTLEFEHGLLDDAVVEVDHVGGDLLFELGVAVHDRLQLLLAQAVRIQVRQGLVEELRLGAEQVLVTANDGLLAQLHVEVALLLVTEADAVLARLLFLFGRALRDDVDLFIDLIIFLENVLLGGVEARLK